MSKKGKPVIHVVAQSHIDLAWLWRWDPETVQVCCKKTFGKATDNLDKFPEYMFTQSQVPLYQATEQHHAEIFKKIEAGIKAGRWEIAGGMYVEAEGGEPSGESLVRQCVLGKRYFKQRFGIDVTTGWQEDSWSHPWQLPQIFKKCGIDAYMFKRGKRNPCIFWWEAPDGSKVLAIKPLHALKGFGFWIFDWGEVLKWTERCKSEYGLNEIMVRIGEGDHGGGPRSDEIEAVRSWAEEYKESMDVRFDTFKDYKDVVLANPGNFPTVKNELDFELQGDLTDCCEIKRRNRLCEVLLLSAEKVSIIAKSAASFEYPERELQGAWEKLLFNQFHDILGGSGIPEVNADAHADYDKIEKISCTCIENALAAMTSTIDTRSKDKSAVPLVIFNPLSWDRVETVEWSFTIPSYAEGIQVTDAKGISISHQEIKRVFTKDSITIDFTFEARVPAMGHTVYHVMHAGILPAPKSAFIVQDGDPFVMESQTFRIEIDR
nr:hypothetical protein [Candidatus Sigynarchaeota archaeon]